MQRSIESWKHPPCVLGVNGTVNLFIVPKTVDNPDNPIVD